MDEEWREVMDWPYEVSSFGRVRRSRKGIHTHIGNVLKPSVSRKGLGYERVTLSKRGKRESMFVHILVADAFLGPKPWQMERHHIDGNKTNNRVDNLKYVTHLENVRSGKVTKLTAEIVSEIRATVDPILKKHNIAPDTLAKILARKTWKDV